jgi:hypothetical protein
MQAKGMYVPLEKSIFDHSWGFTITFFVTLQNDS